MATQIDVTTGVETATPTLNPGVHHTTLHPTGTKIVPTKGQPFKGTISTAMFNSGYPYSYPYGIRFHYNPNSVNIGTFMDDSVPPNAMDIFSKNGLNLWVHQQAISFSFILNRIADMSETNVKNFVPVIVAEDLRRIKKYGTAYDLDFLYHAINGDTFYTDPAGWTNSDVGFLFPTALKFQLGKNWAFYGFVQSITVSHQQFTLDMIPTYTQVDIAVARMSSTKAVPVDGSGVPQAGDNHEGEGGGHGLSSTDKVGTTKSTGTQQSRRGNGRQQTAN